MKKIQYVAIALSLMTLSASSVFSMEELPKEGQYKGIHFDGAQMPNIGRGFDGQGRVPKIGKALESVGLDENLAIRTAFEESCQKFAYKGFNEYMKLIESVYELDPTQGDEVFFNCKPYVAQAIKDIHAFYKVDSTKFNDEKKKNNAVWGALVAYWVEVVAIPTAKRLKDEAEMLYLRLTHSGDIKDGEILQVLGFKTN